ncbi:hypothetical protein [Chelativorans salis]|uniref:Plasmid stabilization protein n=1 Tax=Chelativorans salis TaxID=2978478 RepID=A0ABT2LT49_9HYPH|nr:hypothetical protein [Chelativorans sp. EGI FJ00035]MCT7377022.1 hypothetical protein [Chelativorans sp. EGI FJ00035]
MAKKHTKAETDLRKTSGTETAHERAKAQPDTEDLTGPEEVWKDAETTPARDRKRASGGDRVADAGDVGGGQASPYGTEAQADALARQTKRADEPRGVEKPKRR